MICAGSSVLCSPVSKVEELELEPGMLTEVNVIYRKHMQKRELVGRNSLSTIHSNIYI